MNANLWIFREILIKNCLSSPLIQSLFEYKMWLTTLTTHWVDGNLIRRVSLIITFAAEKVSAEGAESVCWTQQTSACGIRGFGVGVGSRLTPRFMTQAKARLTMMHVICSQMNTPVKPAPWKVICSPRLCAVHSAWLRRAHTYCLSY